MKFEARAAKKPRICEERGGICVAFPIYSFTWKLESAYEDRPTPTTMGIVVSHSVRVTASCDQWTQCQCVCVGGDSSNTVLTDPRSSCASASDDTGSADLTVSAKEALLVDTL
jgi:hypothetical protein